MAFAGTGVFDQLGKARSVVHRLLTSPFFTNFSLKRIEKDQDFYEKMDQLYKSSFREESDTEDRIKVHPIISSFTVNRRNKRNPSMDRE